MSNFHTTIHCIGARRNGIVIVTFTPFRVLTINWDSIVEYAATLSTEPDPESVYLDLCTALTALVLDLSEQNSFGMIDKDPALATLSAMRNTGVRVNNGDLCLTGIIDPEAHNTMMHDGTVARRKGYSMIHEVIDMIIDEPPNTPYNITPKKDDGYDGSGGDGGGGGGSHHNH